MRWLKQQVRQRLRQQRLHLDPIQQSRAALLIAHHLFQTTYFQQAHTIALYHAFVGEVSTLPILDQALKYKSCYFPVLSNSNHLQFVKVESNSKLVKNRFGIFEPQMPHNAILAPQALDLVILPLVAFDAQGHRLGMGKGYYDQTFAFKRHQPHKPRLVGLAYDFQKVNRLPHSDLDISLDEIVTDKGIYHPHKSLKKGR